MGTDSNRIVTSIEYRHDVRAIQSEAASLYYLEDDEKTDIGILVIRDGTPLHIVLNKKQAFTLAKEFKEICEERFGEII